MLPRLLQLASPSLPVGAYAHSEGLEYAVQVGWICDEASAERWISGLLHATIGRLDIPMFGRLLNAWHTEADACEEATPLSAWLLATRETLDSTINPGQFVQNMLCSTLRHSFPHSTLITFLHKDPSIPSKPSLCSPIVHQPLQPHASCHRGCAIVARS